LACGPLPGGTRRTRGGRSRSAPQASTGNNSCGGTSKVNADPKAWIYVPEGYCDRIVGGSKTPKA
jgi:uncharacterized membrane protein